MAKDLIILIFIEVVKKKFFCVIFFFVIQHKLIDLSNMVSLVCSFYEIVLISFFKTSKIGD